MKTSAYIFFQATIEGGTYYWDTYSFYTEWQATENKLKAELQHWLQLEEDQISKKVGELVAIG